MILEGIVTTTDASGGLHLAAMGPEVDEAAARSGRIERMVLKPFATSQTAVHLRRHPEGVFHLTDDVLLLARLVADRLETPPPVRPATAAAGHVLVDACQAYEFVIDSADDSAERLRLEARVVAAHAGRPFIGFNRAAHAVVEAAIVVTRLHLLGPAEVARQLAALAPLVEKTGGAREREAFALLERRGMAG
jgi:hypothetical protein